MNTLRDSLIAWLSAHPRTDAEVLSELSDTLHDSGQGILVLHAPEYNLDILRAIDSLAAEVANNIDDSTNHDILRNELVRCAGYIQTGSL